MYCNNCGSWLPDNCKFCPNCGTPTRNATKDDVDAAPEAPDTYAEYNGWDNGDFAENVYSYEEEDRAPSVPYSEVTSAPHQEGPMRTDRDIIVYIVLSIVTCGIFGFYYVYKMAQDANTICADDGDATPGLAVYLLLSIVTCGIYSFWWEYKLANRLKANGRRYGVDIAEGGSDVLMWLILGLVTCGLCQYVAMYILTKNLNALSEAYNRRLGYR